MTQEFYINSGSILPVLRMELINDGRYDYVYGSNNQGGITQTTNVNINGGSAKNSVSANCEVSIDFRIANKEHIKEISFFIFITLVDLL